MKWFENVDCVEVLKAQYRKLAGKHHPDVGGNTLDMQEINREYEILFEKYKDIHAGVDKETGNRTVYESQKKTAEVASDFIWIVNELFKLDGLDIEMCGRWIWIGGNTMKHREQLKKLGCAWSPKKKLWSWHYPEDSAIRYKGRKEWSMNKIRSYFGSEMVGKQEEKLAIPA